MAKRKSKVIRSRQPININIGMIVFFVFFVYVAINIVSYATRIKVQIYEVGEDSSMVKDSTYSGLILRTEAVQSAPEAGYVNFYKREGDRASVGDMMCSLDASGQYTQMLSASEAGNSSLSPDELENLKKKLSAYTAAYQSVNFDGLYDVKFSLQSLLFSYLGTDTLEQLSSLGIDTSSLNMVTAEHSGIVECYSDGMEEKTEDSLTADDINGSSYERVSVMPGSQVEKGAPLFKTITSEKWYIYLPLTDQDRTDLVDETKITLYFNDLDTELTVDFSLVSISDGTIVGKCTLNDYMLQLANQRYTTVTIRKSKISELYIKGLKIPKSSLVSKDFIVVPEEYGCYGGNTRDIGFFSEIYSADGTLVEFGTPAIYATANDFYYLDPETTPAGTVLRQPSASAISQKDVPEAEREVAKPTDATYTLSTTDSLQGVLCINKGYAVFKPVTIIDENEDYYIVAEKQDYGLAVYDHILLNGQSAKEGDLVFQ